MGSSPGMKVDTAVGVLKSLIGVGFFRSCLGPELFALSDFLIVDDR